jgi:hypothetical protein
MQRSSLLEVTNFRFYLLSGEGFFDFSSFRQRSGSFSIHSMQPFYLIFCSFSREQRRSVYQLSLFF